MRTQITYIHLKYMRSSKKRKMRKDQKQTEFGSEAKKRRKKSIGKCMNR